MGGSPLLSFPTFSSISTRPVSRSEIHVPSAIQCKVVQWAKRLRPEPKLGQAWSLRKTTWSRWRLCRVVSRVHGSSPGFLSWEGAEGFLFLLSLWYHFDPVDRGQWIDRSRFRMCSCGERSLRSGRVDQVVCRAAGVLCQSDMLAGVISASNSADGSPPQPGECVPVVLVA